MDCVVLSDQESKWTVESFFGPGGLLSQHMSGYEERPQQRDLAMSIDMAMWAGEHVIAEGKTGVGKSLAYLVPSISNVLADRKAEKNDKEDTGEEAEEEKEEEEEKGNRVVVATANIALQEQLVEKDLPFLQTVIPDSFSFRLVKGRNNYLCWFARREFLEDCAKVAFGDDVASLTDEELLGKIDGIVFAISNVESHILDWSKRTEEGDRSELQIEPTDKEWSKFSKYSDECLGTDCPYHGSCFIQRLRRLLYNTDVIVVNYHLLYAAIKVRRKISRDVVLPPFKYLVLDEAHRAPDIARVFFGWDISGPALLRILARLRKIRSGDDVDILEHEIDAFVDDLDVLYGSRKNAIRIRESNVIKGLSLAGSLRTAGLAFLDAAGDTEVKKEKAKFKNLEARAAEMAVQLESATGLLDGNGVYFVERFGKSRGLRLSKRMKRVGDFLWDNLFKATSTSVVTSATLSIEDEFGFIRDEIGLKSAREILVGSSFDYREQGLLIMSPNAPDPKKPDYAEKVSKILVYAIDQAGGRTLGLFTSYRVLREAASVVREHFNGRYRVMVQGDAPRMVLVNRFREDIHSVLLGTESFWTGVDVKGEALSCLVVDKIPFPVPGEPVLDALSEDAGKRAFLDISVPRAVLQLKQGVGRLIRSELDRGVVIILDNRLVTKPYGRLFVRSLPGFRRAKTLKGVIGPWLAGEPG